MQSLLFLSLRSSKLSLNNYSYYPVNLISVLRGTKVESQWFCPFKFSKVDKKKIVTTKNVQIVIHFRTKLEYFFYNIVCMNLYTYVIRVLFTAFDLDASMKI